MNGGYFYGMLPKQPNHKFNPLFWLLVLATILILIGIAKAEEIYLTASWYSIESLKKEGTYKYSKGVMANGKLFRDDAFTCATQLFPLGSSLRITNLFNQKSVEVKVTDRIGKRFAKTRIDLTPAAMETLGGKQALIQGLLKVKIERIK